MNILWQGARGVAVTELQSTLKDKGFYKGKINGIFNPLTTKAVLTFQKDQKLFADGIVAYETVKALGLPQARIVSSQRSKVRRQQPRTKVFVSYSHVDKKWINMLKVFIAPLVQSNIVELWDDTKIKPGQDWKVQIHLAIKSSKVAVLLVSPFFMASEFITQYELPKLLSDAATKGMVILPVIISPCILGSLSNIQAVNSPEKTLVDLNIGERGRVWVKLVESITSALNNG